VVYGLPDHPAEVKDLKQKFLRQIEEAEKASRLHSQIDSAIERAKGLVSNGNYAEAKSVVNSLPDQSDDLRQLKRNWLSQIQEVEQSARKATSENNDILQRLRRRGLNMEALRQVARENNIDMSNALQFNALLKAVEQQL
jgi:hypothetical protein